MVKETMSAGGIIINSRGEVAVVNQKHRSWSLPKGHVEENEDLFEAAVREIREETGITELTLIKQLEIYSRYALNYNNGDNTEELKKLHFYLFSTTELDLKPEDKDNPEAIWVKKEEVEGYLSHPEDKKFFRSVLENHLGDVVESS